MVRQQIPSRRQSGGRPWATSPRRATTNSFSRKLTRAVPPRHHAAEQPVSHNHRVKQNGSKMGDECEEEEVCQNRMRLTQYGVRHHAVWKDREKM
jgi:hypothetical protein